MKTIVLFAFNLFIFSATCFSQTGNSHFYAEGYGRLLNREHVYSVSINTENTTDSFFHALSKQLSKVVYEDGYAVYRCNKPAWSKEKVVVRIQHGLQTDLQNRTSNILFIYAEIAGGKDLLRPKTKSYSKIRDFFEQLYNQTIVNAAPDDFKAK